MVDLSAAHAKYSASSSARWLACPGSVALSLKLPPPPETEYAAEGTQAHEVLEFLLKRLGTSVLASRRELISKGYAKEMIDHGMDAASLIEDLWQGELGKQATDGTLLTETRVDLSFVAPAMFGTVDAAILGHYNRLHVIDYKYGAGIAVEAENNSQLAYYALGIAHLYDYNFVDVALTIIQPRAYHPQGPLREWIIPIGELYAWRQRFAEGVAACQKPDALLSAGDHCRWCPAKLICPELSTKALETAEVQLQKNTLLVPPLAKIDLVDRYDLGELLSAAERLEVWIKALRENAFARLRKGDCVEGYKLVEKRPTRRWLNLDLALTEAKKLFGEKATDPPTLKSPAQFEKALKGDLKAAKFLEASTVTVSSGLAMVSAKDKRPNAMEVPIIGPFECLNEIEL